jgi:hypothetical protein
MVWVVSKDTQLTGIELGVVHTVTRHENDLLPLAACKKHEISQTL